MRMAVMLMLVGSAVARAADAPPAEYGFARDNRIWVESSRSIRADLTAVDAINPENGKHLRRTVTRADPEKKGEWISTVTYQFQGPPDDSAQLIVLFTAPARATVRVCTSSEGLHLTAWSGPWKKKGSRRLWHGYWPLDMDVESNCTDRETGD